MRQTISTLSMETGEVAMVACMHEGRKEERDNRFNWVYYFSGVVHIMVWWVQALIFYMCLKYASIRMSH